MSFIESIFNDHGFLQVLESLVSLFI